MPDSLWSKEPPPTGPVWLRRQGCAPVIALAFRNDNGETMFRIPPGDTQLFWAADCEWCPVPTPEQMVRLVKDGHWIGCRAKCHLEDVVAENVVRAALEKTDAVD